MRIGVDLDGVTVDFQYHWAQLYRSYFGSELEVGEWYEGLEKYNALLDLTHFEKAPEFFDWFHRAGGWKTQPYLEGSRGGVDALMAAGHVVKFITNRPPEAHQATFDWLDASPFWGTEVHVRADKWMIPCEVYVDDTPSMIEAIAAEGKHVIVFDQPWNQEVESNELITRAKGWPEVVAAVDFLDKYGDFIGPPNDQPASTEALEEQATEEVPS